MFATKEYHCKKLLAAGAPSKLSLPFLFLLLILTLWACASLPRMEENQALSETNSPPTIVGPRGEVSPQRGEAIIKRLEKQAAVTDLLQQQIALVQAISGSPLVEGNKATLLVDGPATYAAMKKAIREARDFIDFETFIFADDETGRSFADLFLQKQAEGVQVNLIYDSVGCRNVPASFFQRLRDGRVKALEFNPVDPAKARGKWLLVERDHRKLLVVDGKVAFAGGVNISDVYSESSSRKSSGISRSGAMEDEYSQRFSGRYLRGGVREPWRDTQVQIDGPAVAQFQKLFLETWARQKGPAITAQNHFPSLKREGDDLVRVVGSLPGKNNRTTYLLYLSAISHAQRSIHLTNAYFVPDDETVEELLKASRRGVDVRIILPGTSDLGFVYYAGRSYYTQLLKAGVKVYERKKAILHAKTAVIDGVWSTIGSTNMDLWSFLRNDEVNTVILGLNFGKEMEALFARDLADSNQILLDEWEKRSFTERLKEWFTRLFRYWL